MANHHESLGDIPAMVPSRCVPASPAPAAGRRAELDVLRALVVVGLVIFHSAVVFASGTSWFVKDPRPSVGFTVFLLWASLWGMPLLFLVSGIGVGHALRTRSARAFVTERVLRLLVPFLVGLTLLVPPMFYLEYLRQPGFHESYGHFWLRFLNVSALASGLLPRGSWTSRGTEFDPAHLWFLYCLLTFSLVLLPLFSYLRGARGIRLVDRTAAFTTGHRHAVLLAGGIPMALIEATFGPDVNTGGWERLTYLVPLLIGYLIARDPRFDTALRTARRPALVCALLGTVALIVWAGVLGSGDDLTNGHAPGWSALQGLTGWWWLAAIMGFASSLSDARARSRASGPTPTSHTPLSGAVARYANQAVLPFYILHEPIIVAAAWVIIRWRWPILAKYVVLVIASFASTLVVYELLVRRLRLTRMLFGMKPTASPTRE
jgi:glucan biosynthesis protein C